MVCKLCHSEKTIPNKEVMSSVAKLKYTLWKCKQCESYFFDEKQHIFKLDEMYESLSINRQTFSVDFVPNKSWLNQKQQIVNQLGHMPVSILDVGCRTGDFLMHFDADIRRTGVELSSHFAGIGRQRGLTVIQDFLENIHFTEQYEVVTCFAILEHLYDPLKFLDSLQALVQPGGLLVIMIPSIETLKAACTGLNWHMFSPPEHLNFYSRNFLDTYLHGRQFKKILRYYTSGGMLMYKGPRRLIAKTEAVLNQIIDISFLRKLPVFDHMYTYYYNTNGG
jgi:SAM-dependent methyltransferase